MKRTIGGEVTRSGMVLGIHLPGDPDYRWTSLIAEALRTLGDSRPLTLETLDELVGEWAPHADPAPHEDLEAVVRRVDAQLIEDLKKLGF